LVASEGVGGTSAVNIANTPHMFTVLSSGLYSDKIAAVLREPGCNAMDAHIMTDQADRPFQVKLPSALDRTFYVKDWGPGLDDREFRELYTTYGWSNKQQRNDATGAFGLGSKSPFAYTTQNSEDSDGYTVETVKNGSRRIYTCYIGDNGTPQVTLLHESAADADWPHGLKVTFPVQSGDIEEFHQKARQVFQWFTVKPEVLGLHSPLVTPTFKLSGAFFGMGRYEATDSAAVVMGNVRYPLRVERLKGLTPLETTVARMVTLFLPLGSVMMTPSREELEYTEATRTTVQKWVGRAATEIANKIREAVQTPAETQWEWSRRVLNYYEELPAALKGMQFKELLTYAGVGQDEAVRISEMVDERKVAVPRWVGDGPFDAGEGDKASEHYRVFHYSNLAGQVRRHEVRQSYSTAKFLQTKDNGPARLSLSYLDDVTVFVADSPMADARVRELVRDNGGAPLLVVPHQKTNLRGAEVYAQRIVNAPALKGIALSHTSTLPVPRADAERKALEKAKKELTPRQRMAKNQVEVVVLSTGAVELVTLGDIPDNEMFYLLGKNFASAWKANYFNNPGELPDSPFLSTGGNRVGPVLVHAKELAQHFGMNVDRVAVLPRQTAVNRLKLKEQGFAPFFATLNAKVAKDLELKKLMAALPTSKREKEIPELGWLGFFMKAGLSPEARAARVLRESPAARAALEVAEAAAYIDRSFVETRLCDMLTALRGQVICRDNKVFTAGVGEPAYTRGQAFSKNYPALGLLSLTEIRALWDEEPTMAARVLAAVFEELEAKEGRMRVEAPHAQEASALPLFAAHAQPTSQELDPLVAALLKQDNCFQ
jgi:hypothetical protein